MTILLASNLNEKLQRNIHRKHEKQTLKEVFNRLRNYIGLLEKLVDV